MIHSNFIIAVGIRSTCAIFKCLKAFCVFFVYVCVCVCARLFSVMPMPGVLVNVLLYFSHILWPSWWSRHLHKWFSDKFLFVKWCGSGSWHLALSPSLSLWLNVFWPSTFYIGLGNDSMWLSLHFTPLHLFVGLSICTPLKYFGIGRAPYCII